MSDKLPPDVDRSKWSPSVDCRGNPISPGDLVSQPVFPRGTIRGTLEASSRSWSVLPDGSKILNLVVVTSDGIQYSTGSKIKKLKQESSIRAGTILTIDDAVNLPVGSVITFAKNHGQFHGKAIISGPGLGSPNLSLAKTDQCDSNQVGMPIREWVAGFGDLIYLVYRGRGTLPSQSAIDKAISKFMDINANNRQKL